MATRDVQFIIRARDEASRAFEGLSSALQQITSWNGKAGDSSNLLSTDLGKLVAVLGSVDQVARTVGGASERAGSAFEQQRAKVQALEGDLANLKSQATAAQNAMASVKAAGAATGNTEQTATQVTAITTAQKQLNNQIDQTSRKLGTARTDLAALGTEYQRVASLANAFDDISPNATGMRDQLAAAEAVAGFAKQIEGSYQRDVAWVDQLRQKLNPLAGIQEHYRIEIEKANAARAAGLYATEKEYQQVVKLLEVEKKRTLASAGVGPDGRPSLFGLKPWQATNLMYQVNDVVSGIAMGQKPSQIIAQQLGQIVQLFPRLGSGIMAAFSNPYFLGAAAIFTAISFATKQAADQAERLRMFAGILKANADGAQYSATALNENVKALQQYHLTADEAVAITRTLVKEGLDPSYFEQFGMAAKDMSRVLGIEVKDAATQVAQAFTGGYESIVKLDEATNFLTVSERDHIRALFDSGQAAKARREAFDKFRKSQHDAAEEMRGPWTQAIERIDSAWERTKSNLADSSWANALRKGLEGSASLLERLADAIDRVNKVDQEYAQRHNASVTVKLPGATQATAEQEARVRAGNVDPRAAQEADAKAAADTRREIALQRELQNATSDTAKIRVAGEQAYRTEIEKTGNTAVAQLKRQAAEEAELTRIQMERRKSLLTSAEQFLGKREGNREDVAILEGLFNQYGIKTPQGTTVDPQKLAWCAAFVNAMLASKGLPTTGSLAASSFKSYGTSVKVEDAQPGDIVVLDHHVGIFAGFGPNGTVRILGGNQGKQGAVSIENFKRSAVQAVRRPGNIGEGYDQPDSEAQYAMQIASAQDAFNKKLEVEAAQRALVIKFMREQLGMSAQQLYDSQREEEIQKAILAAKQEATDKHIAFSPEQAAALRKQVGDQYDLEHGLQLVNDRIKEQTDLRNALMQGIGAASARGDDATVARLTEQLNALKPALQDAIKKAEEWWQKMPNSPAKEAALEGLRQLRTEIENTAFALSKIKLDRIDQQIQGGSSLEESLQNRVDMAQLLGDRGAARAAESQLDAVRVKLIELRQQAIDAWRAVLADPEALKGAEAQGFTADGIQAIINQLQAAQMETAMMGRQFLMTGRQINEMIADQLVAGAERWLQLIQQGKGVFAALGIAAAETAAQILMDLGKMILKQALFNAIAGKNGQGGLGGSIATSIATLFPAAITMQTAGVTLSAAGGVLTGAAAGLGVSAASLMAAAQMLIVANTMMTIGAAHGGGIAGSPTMFRSVHPGVFSAAARYHSGGIAGLRPNEIPTILERGEEVLTRKDPRHRLNGGMDGSGGSPGRGLRQILAIGDDEIAKAIAGVAGEEVVLTHLRRNRVTIKQMLSE